MKYFKHPEPIVPTPPTSDAPSEGAAPIKFLSFVKTAILADKKFGASFRTLLSAEKIAEQIAKTSPGETIALEDADYDMFRSVVEEPSLGYNPTLALQFMPWLKAILDASSTEE